MILQELVGVLDLVSLSTLLFPQVPQICRENLRRHDWLIFEQSSEDEGLEEELVDRQ